MYRYESIGLEAIKIRISLSGFIIDLTHVLKVSCNPGRYCIIYGQIICVSIFRMSLYIFVYSIAYLPIIFPNYLLKVLMSMFPHRSPLKSEPSDESDANTKLKQTSRKKKKEKKKKRKHQHHKKTRRKHGQSDSSGSEPDTGAEKDSSSRSRDSKKESERLP